MFLYRKAGVLGKYVPETGGSGEIPELFDRKEIVKRRIRYVNILLKK